MKVNLVSMRRMWRRKPSMTILAQKNRRKTQTIAIQRADCLFIRLVRSLFSSLICMLFVMKILKSKSLSQHVKVIENQHFFKKRFEDHKKFKVSI